MSALPTTVSADDTMVVGSLQVLKADLGAMTWSDATQRSASLGANWRLPSIVELQQLFDRKDEIGGFVDNLYWSSDEVPPANACIQSFVELKTANDDKNYLFFVRPVRSAETIALQGLEILDTDLGLLHWDEANTACARVGSGWRLPRRTSSTFSSGTRTQSADSSTVSTGAPQRLRRNCRASRVSSTASSPRIVRRTSSTCVPSGPHNREIA